MGFCVYIAGDSELGMSVKIPFEFTLPTGRTLRRDLCLKPLRFRQAEDSVKRFVNLFPQVADNIRTHELQYWALCCSNSHHCA